MLISPNPDETVPDWWDSQPLGKIVHYHNGFNCYLRGRVVAGAGQKHMLPFALVGRWGATDIPRREVDGTIHLPYYARKIHERAPTRPHYSNMWEAVGHTWASLNRIDPTDLPEIDLSVPDMTPSQQRRADAEGERIALMNILQNTGCPLSAVHLVRRRLMEMAQ
jgi:hypothetical protein